MNLVKDWYDGCSGIIAAMAEPDRGNGGPAMALLDALLARARALDMADIVLDTPAVATRSHAFYERNGFRRAVARDLPAGYRYPDRDSFPYCLELVCPP